MPAAEFNRIVRELGALSETVKIQVFKNQVRFSVAGDSTTGEITLNENNIDTPGETVRIDSDTDGLDQSFSLQFLASFCKASVLSDSVKLYMTENNPLVIEFKIADLGELKYYLAPKLSEN